MIQMENVTKQYANGVTAIKNLNLEIFLRARTDNS